MKHYIVTLLPIILILSSTIFANSQCLYTWQKIDAKSTNNDTNNAFYLYSPYDTSFTIDFDALVNIVEVPPLYKRSFIEYLIKEIDSLKTISDSLTQEKIKTLQEVDSIFQFITLKNIQYVLYDIDTFKLDNEDIFVYDLVTNFTRDWNEDNINYHFYYTTTYGLIRVNFWSEYFQNSWLKYKIEPTCKLPDKYFTKRQQIDSFVRSRNLTVEY